MLRNKAAGHKFKHEAGRSESGKVQQVYLQQQQQQQTNASGFYDVPVLRMQCMPDGEVAVHAKWQSWCD